MEIGIAFAHISAVEEVKMEKKSENIAQIKPANSKRQISVSPHSWMEASDLLHGLFMRSTRAVDSSTDASAAAERIKTKVSATWPDKSGKNSSLNNLTHKTRG